MLSVPYMNRLTSLLIKYQNKEKGSLYRGLGIFT